MVHSPSGALISNLLLLPKRRDLLTDPINRFHPMEDLQLAAWKVSGDSTTIWEYQTGLQSSSWLDGVRGQTWPISQPGKDGVAGVLNGKLIPFHVESNCSPFLDFLADLFEQGLQHQTINVIHSAISMTHLQVEGISIGQHPLVARLIKGVHNSRPSKPRYTVTWDVDTVLKHLRALGNNNNLSLRALSKKLALLTALMDASSTSELQALDLCFRRFRSERLYFTLASLTKKRKMGAPPKELFFGAFPQDHTLCVGQCLREYEKVNKDICPKNSSEANPLFLFICLSLFPFRFKACSKVKAKIWSAKKLYVCSGLYM